MAIKFDVILRHCCSRGKKTIGMVLMGVIALLPVACKSLFDSPPGSESEHDQILLKKMDELNSLNQEGVVDKAAKAGMDEAGKGKDKIGQGMAGNMKTNHTDASKPGNEPKEDELVKWETPRLSFERFKADMPQLAVRGLDEATFLVDDKQIELGRMTRDGRIALIAPGQHWLQVKCPFDPPFSVTFRLVKDDRIVLRGRCSSGKRTAAGEGKGN